MNNNTNNNIVEEVMADPLNSSFSSSTFSSSIISSTNGNSGGNSAVRVVCRFRPITDLEYKRNEHSIVTFHDKTSFSLKLKDGNIPQFSFDRTFNSDEGQTVIYNEVAKPMISDFFDGYNSTILAYGQTASGKTYTIYGDPTHMIDGNQPINEIDNHHDDDNTNTISQHQQDQINERKFSNYGIIPRMIEETFSNISKLRDTNTSLSFVIKMSALEIYMEKVNDLYDQSKKDLKIKNHKEEGIFVENLTQVYIQSPKDAYEFINYTNSNRATAATKMSSVSSRSHSIVIIELFQQNLLDLSSKRSKLYLVDLAGSERLSKTGAEGERMIEATKINLSLTTLGMVIKALTSGEKFVKYRDSKLTRVLKDSLGGNSKTTLIIACSPSNGNEFETQSTIQFGLRTKNLKNKPIINKQVTVNELKSEIDQLRNELKEKSSYIDKQSNTILTLENEILIKNVEIDDLRLNQTILSNNNQNLLTYNTTLQNDKNDKNDKNFDPIQNNSLPTSPISLNNSNNNIINSVNNNNNLKIDNKLITKLKKNSSKTTIMKDSFQQQSDESSIEEDDLTEEEEVEEEEDEIIIEEEFSEIDSNVLLLNMVDNANEIQQQLPLPISVDDIQVLKKENDIGMVDSVEQIEQKLEIQSSPLVVVNSNSLGVADEPLNDMMDEYDFIENLSHNSNTSSNFFLMNETNTNIGNNNNSNNIFTTQDFIQDAYEINDNSSLKNSNSTSNLLQISNSNINIGQLDIDNINLSTSSVKYLKNIETQIENININSSSGSSNSNSVPELPTLSKSTTTTPTIFSIQSPDLEFEDKIQLLNKPSLSKVEQPNLDLVTPLIVKKSSFHSLKWISILFISILFIFILLSSHLNSPPDYNQLTNREIVKNLDLLGIKSLYPTLPQIKSARTNTLTKINKSRNKKLCSSKCDQLEMEINASYELLIKHFENPSLFEQILSFFSNTLDESSRIQIDYMFIEYKQFEDLENQIKNLKSSIKEKDNSIENLNSKIDQLQRNIADNNQKQQQQINDINNNTPQEREIEIIVKKEEIKDSDASLQIEVQQEENPVSNIDNLNIDDKISKDVVDINENEQSKLMEPSEEEKKEPMEENLKTESQIVEVQGINYFNRLLLGFNNTFKPMKERIFDWIFNIFGKPKSKSK